MYEGDNPSALLREQPDQPKPLLQRLMLLIAAQKTQSGSHMHRAVVCSTMLWSPEKLGEEAKGLWGRFSASIPGRQPVAAMEVITKISRGNTLQ